MRAQANMDRQSNGKVTALMRRLPRGGSAAFPCPSSKSSKLASTGIAGFCGGPRTRVSMAAYARGPYRLARSELRTGEDTVLLRKLISEHGFNISMLLLFGVAAYSWAKSDNETVKHIMEAMAIAAFLALTVDQYVKERLSREIAKDVAPLIFAYGTPGSIAEEIKYFRGITIVRQNMELNYKIERVDANYLAIETEMQYSVLNYSDTSQEFAHLAQVIADKYGHIEHAQILGAEAQGPDLRKKDRYSFPNDGPVPVKRSTTPPVIEFKKAVLIRPNRDRVSNRFWWRTREICDCYDSDVVFFPQPVVGLTVRILSMPNDLVVDVFFGHRRSAEVEASPKQAPTRWFLDAAFPPYGSLTITWQPKKAETKKAPAK